MIGIVGAVPFSEGKQKKVDLGERRGMCGELREEVVGKLQLNIIHKKIKLKNLFFFYDTLSGQYLQFHFVQWSFWLRPGFLVFTNTWESRRSNWVAFCNKGFWRPLFYSSHKRQRGLFHGKIPLELMGYLQK